MDSYTDDDEDSNNSNSTPVQTIITDLTVEEDGAESTSKSPPPIIDSHLRPSPLRVSTPPTSPEVSPARGLRGKEQPTDRILVGPSYRPSTIHAIIL